MLDVIILSKSYNIFLYGRVILVIFQIQGFIVLLLNSFFIPKVLILVILNKKNNITLLKFTAIWLRPNERTAPIARQDNKTMKILDTFCV